VTSSVATEQAAAVTEYGIPIRNVWHMLLYAWGQYPDAKRWRSEVERAPSLEGLLAMVLARLVEQRLRIGLGREYVAVDRRLRGIRGRVDFNRSLLDRTFEQGEAHCRYESFEVDAPRNQIIKSMLARLVREGRFGPNLSEAKQLRHRLRRLVRDLDGINPVAVDIDHIRRVQLGRNDGDYRLMLSICEYLLETSMPTEYSGRRASTKVNRDDLTLYKLFEQFVAAFFRQHLSGWQVSRQSGMPWPVETVVPRLPMMIPDLVLHDPRESRMIVLDTKFTAGSLRTGVGGKSTYDSSHLYQLYAYLRTQEAKSPVHRVASGVLLYPGAGTELSDRFIVQGHEVRIETVDLAGDWTTVERRLLDTVRSSAPASLINPAT
jgi:5-methylcytosine-specific restriction enzyme subunit McrC